MQARVYFGKCPNHHFVLFDEASPTFQDSPPELRYKAVCLGCGPSAVVELPEVFYGEVSAEERDRGWTLTMPVLIVELSHHGAAIKLNQNRAKAEEPQVNMGIVTCDECGDQFYIAQHKAFQNQVEATSQAQRLEELLEEQHKRKQPHSDSIKF